MQIYTECTNIYKYTNIQQYTKHTKTYKNMQQHTKIYKIRKI